MGANATAEKLDSLPSPRHANSRPSLGSHSRTVPSAEAVAIHAPSGAERAVGDAAASVRAPRRNPHAIRDVPHAHPPEGIARREPSIVRGKRRAARDDAAPVRVRTRAGSDGDVAAAEHRAEARRGGGVPEGHGAFAGARGREDGSSTRVRAPRRSVLAPGSSPHLRICPVCSPRRRRRRGWTVRTPRTPSRRPGSNTRPRRARRTPSPPTDLCASSEAATRNTDRPPPAVTMASDPRATTRARRRPRARVVTPKTHARGPTRPAPPRGARGARRPHPPSRRWRRRGDETQSRTRFACAPRASRARETSSAWAPAGAPSARAGPGSRLDEPALAPRACRRDAPPQPRARRRRVHRDRDRGVRAAIAIAMTVAVPSCVAAPSRRLRRVSGRSGAASRSAPTSQSARSASVAPAAAATYNGVRPSSSLASFFGARWGSARDRSAGRARAPPPTPPTTAHRRTPSPPRVGFEPRHLRVGIVRRRARTRTRARARTSHPPSPPPAGGVELVPSRIRMTSGAIVRGGDVKQRRAVRWKPRRRVRARVHE